MQLCAMTWIPDNPPERQYTCPGCNKSVIATRIDESCSYVITHPDEKKTKGSDGDGKCKYKGPISHKLLGYKPLKVKKDEPTTESGSSD